MTPRRNFALALALALLLSAVCSLADNKDDKSNKLSEDGRRTLLRTLTAEMVYARKFFPMGKTGLTIKEGQVIPADPEVRQMVADNGPAAKPGDRVKITQLIFKGDTIIFEINGGPIKKKKWYDRLEVGSTGGSTTANPNGPKGSVDDLYINARGSYVALKFKDYIPEIGPDAVKKMLEPVFDWKAASVAEAYTKALSPQLQEAVKNHKALVGMDREMVVYAKGRPERRHREHDPVANTDYEEWIYGAPPQEVEFVRFVGNTVARIETMTVDGEKIVRTKKEVDLDSQVSTMAQKKEEEKPDAEKKGPSLLRDGEKPAIPERTSAPMKVPKPDRDPNSGPPGGDKTNGDPRTTVPDASTGPPMNPR